MTETRPHSHRLEVSAPARSTPGGVLARWLAAGGIRVSRGLAVTGVVVLAAVLGVTLLLQNGGSACAAPPSSDKHTGKATYYNLGRGMGNCSLPAPANELYVALGPSEYSASDGCGMYLDVTGPKRTTVRVKVVDQCPECKPGHLDLSHTAFTKIGVESDGIIQISYEAVEDPQVPGPLTVRVKEGSSQYWLAVLIDNHGTQLTSLSVAGPDGKFHDARRSDFNYWILEKGAGPGPFRIKITGTHDRSATISGITLSPGRVQQTTARLSGGAVNGARLGEAGKRRKAATPKPSTSSASPKPSVTATVASSMSTGGAAAAELPVDLAGESTSCH